MKAIRPTGLVLTKLDGTAKGGIILRFRENSNFQFVMLALVKEQRT